MSDDTRTARWSDVDDYVDGLLVGQDAALLDALAASHAAGLPSINVTPAHGKMLYLLTKAIGARAVLEIGTLGGYSTIWLARALGAGGRLVTIEADEKHAAVARTNIARAAVADHVDLRIGRALDVLPGIERDGAGPFDVIFIDADKPGTPEYFAWGLRLSRVGTLILIDNVVRDGAILDRDSRDPSVAAMRRVLQTIASEPRVTATVVQTVGGKGYDGLAMVLVTS
jgi:predicted O-methyltransferase YrrM